MRDGDRAAASSSQLSLTSSAVSRSRSRALSRPQTRIAQRSLFAQSFRAVADCSSKFSSLAALASLSSLGEAASSWVFFLSPGHNPQPRASMRQSVPVIPDRANYSTSRHRFIQASLAPRSQQLFIRRSWLPPRWSPVSDSTRCTSCVSHGTAGVARRRRRRRLLRRRPTGCAQFLFCHTARARALPTRLRASTTASASAGTIGALRRIRPFRAAIAFARFSSSPPPPSLA